MQVFSYRKCWSICIIYLVMAVSGFAQEPHEEEGAYHHCLYEPNTASFGIGVSYSDKLTGFGINTRGYYNMGEHLCFGPEFSFFQNENAEKIYDLNLVGHYIFETKWVGVYPIIGVNYTIEEMIGHHEEALGILGGAGVHRNLKKLTFFMEYTHVQSELPDDFFTAGFLYKLK